MFVCHTHIKTLKHVKPLGIGGSCYPWNNGRSLNKAKSTIVYERIFTRLTDWFLQNEIQARYY